ncbi:hypothetical protein LZ495_08480 [Yinghuangia sp. KLBMP8922]|uniref:Uncharacterized protein n=1 Tax=Yinghuangia soli TaxID=2908204 RepID=A0AA41TXW4_9ACTN|nr:hypothetical protein [Yinghuangia soli]
MIRPVRTKNVALYAAEGGNYGLCVDRADGRQLGTLLMLAARSPRSLVYLPLRSTPGVPGIGPPDEQPLDLLLVPRAQQFRPAHWKALRARITAGNAPRELRTASVPESDLGKDVACSRPPGERHTLRQHLHAETLFLTGSSGAFRKAARHVFALTADGPPIAAKYRDLYYAWGCNYHHCTNLYDWEELPDDWRQIHLIFHPTWAR